MPAEPDRLVFVHRDREEELIAIARRLKAGRAGPPPSLDRVAVVFKRPLPYLYLAREVFGSAGLPYQAFDALPLAAEPFAAALDLVFEFVESGFTRRSMVALLRSPHFVFRHDDRPIGRDASRRARSRAERSSAISAVWSGCRTSRLIFRRLRMLQQAAALRHC